MFIYHNIHVFGVWVYGDLQWFSPLLPWRPHLFVWFLAPYGNRALEFVMVTITHSGHSPRKVWGKWQNSVKIMFTVLWLQLLMMNCIPLKYLVCIKIFVTNAVFIFYTIIIMLSLYFSKYGHFVTGGQVVCYLHYYQLMSWIYFVQDNGHLIPCLLIPARGATYEDFLPSTFVAN